MKKLASLLLAVLMVVGLLAACGDAGSSGSSSANTSSSQSQSQSQSGSQAASTPDASRDDGLPAYTGEPVELRFTWWGSDVRVERTNAVIDLFMAAYPDIKITGEPRPSGDDYFIPLDTQLAGGNAPDIIQLGGNWPDYANFLLPLNDLVGQQLQIGTPEEFDQAPLDFTTDNAGNLFGVSLGTNALALFYNKTMLEAANAPLPPASWTWEEMWAYGREIKDLLPEGVSPFVDNSVNQANYISYWYQQHGKPLWSYNEESLADLETSTAWLQMWEDVRAEGLIPDIDTSASYEEQGPDTSALVAGKAAIGLLWSNQLAAYQENMTDTIGLCTLPLGNEDALVIQLSQCVAINKESANPEAAALFINFFVNSPEAGAILGTDRGIPSSPTVREQAQATAGDMDKMLFAYLNEAALHSIPQGPNLPNDQEFVADLKQIGQSVSFGNITPEDGGAELMALIQRLMVK